MNINSTAIVRLFLLTVLFLLSGCREYIELHKQMDEADANEVIAALVSKGVEAKKESKKEGFSVLIDEADMARAVNLLAAEGLPRRHKTSMGEIFKKEGVISTPLEERARYIYALSQELEYTLSQMQGVIVARVHVVLPERIAPGEPINPSSAAVFIKHEKDFDPDVYSARVRQLVASSIPGLWNDKQGNDKQDKIAVVYSVAEKAEITTKWFWVGPFKVESESAAALKNTFISIFVLLPVLLIIFILLPTEKTRLWLLSYIGPYFPQSNKSGR